MYNYRLLREVNTTMDVYDYNTEIIQWSLINVTTYLKYAGADPYIVDKNSHDSQTNNVTWGMAMVHKSAFTQQCVVYRFIFFSLIVGGCCLFGLVGNTVSIFVLRNVTQNQVATFLLQSLAVCDNLVLGITFVALSVSYGLFPIVLDDATAIRSTAFIVKYLQPCAYITNTCTIWLSVLIAINRYQAICRPLQVRHLNTIKRARLHVSLVFIVSIICNFPRFFQYSLKRVPFENTTVYIPYPTSIGENTLFGIIYTNATYSLLVVLLPLLFLIFLNTRLIQAVRKMKVMRTSLSINQPLKHDNVNIIMIIIVLFVIICHFPDRIIQVVRTVVPKEQFACLHVLYYIYSIVNLLVILNSSTNFLIYFLLSRGFRKYCINRMCHKFGYDATVVSTEVHL